MLAPAILASGAAVFGWKPVEGNLMTRWAAQVDPARPLPEYQRPQMVRKEWQNLNGLWDYAVVELGAERPVKFDGKILTPFPIESALSGVKKALTPKQNLWYRRSFAAPAAGSGKRTLLHFGAVDWEATVFLNGKEFGTHRGGYDSFAFDVTDFLARGGQTNWRCGCGIRPAPVGARRASRA